MASLASAAGTQLAQVKGADVERVQQDAGVQQRHAESQLKAENAAGVDAADGEDHLAEDRDADGRRLWEEQAAAKHGQAATEATERRLSRDPTGEAGNQLDLSG